MKQHDAESSSRSPQPFANEGGVRVTPQSERNPYEVLDDLMTVIEALCPTWPKRAPFGKQGKFLL